MYSLGIDLGGTNIKLGIVDGNYNIISQKSCDTNMPRHAGLICDDMISLSFEALDEVKLTLKNIKNIGIACPGTVDDKTGIVRYANNLKWRNFSLRQYMSGSFPGVPIHIGNDANVAAFGEFCAGSAKNASSAVIITLGTGVGSGIIIDSKILTGYNSAAAEIEHMVIEKNGRPCTCGRKGCFEAYCSATGLIATAKAAMEADRKSLMWNMAKEEGKVSGKTAFEAAKQGDIKAQAVVDEYIDYLACGLANVINIFQPEILSIGGGISKQGENILAPLKKALKTRVYGGDLSTEINICTLGNNAGIIGAAKLK